MYINKQDQIDMATIINDFLIETDYGKKTTTKSQRSIDKLFKNYVDKIILGIIFTPKYSFWRYAENDDLIQEGRLAIYKAIIKNNFDTNRGSIFNFFSTVIEKNLMNFTSKHNRHYMKKSSADISKLYNNQSLSYNHDLDKDIVIENVIAMLVVLFEDKPKFQDITLLLADYIYVNHSTRFVKKHFIQFCRSHNYSSAIIGTFFNYLKRFSNNKDIKELLNIIDHEENLRHGDNNGN